MVEPGSTKSERIMHIKLNTDLGPTNLLSVYAPTLTSSTDAKDIFYSQLDDAIKHIPNNEVLILLGDFNARVGNDQGSWPDCLGHFGVGKCNENGQRLLELCTYHRLCITNTFFGVKLHHRFSWMHPRSKNWHQLDLIISRREHLNNIRTTRAYHSADCDSDQSLVCTKIQLRPKKFHRVKQSATLRINASATAIPENVSIFNDILSSKLGDCLELNTEDHWSHIKDTTLAAALKAFGKNVRKVAIRDLLFAHTAEKLQLLLNQFSDVCEAFRLTISLKKTKVMCQANAATPAVTIKDYTLEAVTQFTYLGSTTSNNNCLEVEIGKRIGKAATNMTKLSARVWENKKLTTQTKVAVYRACIVSTLLFGSESWTTYASQEKRLNTFHMRCLRRILSILWTDKVSNNEVLARANIPSMFTLLRQRRLRWLGHVYRMEDGRIPKDLLYDELESGSRPIGRPKLRFKDVCKRDMLANGLPTDNWELHAADRSDWRSVCSLALQAGEERLKAEAVDRRAKRRAEMNKATCVPVACVFVCSGCGRVCRSRIGLFSHKRKFLSQLR
ncbi:uncharacterized protein [Pocillopora verrucosa]|uniref:uncharacterized protein n=1 Tax=Pocillopora verrucosa TaxID=203993 RepID=UPI00333FC51A